MLTKKIILLVSELMSRVKNILHLYIQYINLNVVANEMHQYILKAKKSHHQ